MVSDLQEEHEPAHNPKHAKLTTMIRFADLFCGAGGATTGVLLAAVARHRTPQTAILV